MNQWEKTTDREFIRRMIIFFEINCLPLLCSVQGKRYFTCRPSYGGFVRPEKLRVGDFPPLDLELEDEEI
jgi:hypothetical protein